MSNEELNYEIIETYKNIEIRKYDNMILASVEVQGDKSQAISNGFKIIAKYIFGENSNNKKINMTVPVMQENKSSFNDWEISFVMPSKYNLKNLPSTKDHRVILYEIALKKSNYH